jgi:hypothetical protein
VIASFGLGDTTDRLPVRRAGLRRSVFDESEETYPGSPPEQFENALPCAARGCPHLGHIAKRLLVPYAIALERNHEALVSARSNARLSE